jgi:D-alanyl-D-alanine carboxypeptidase/D-alanyl-D-alanine-endopeptidase (penicillin-binding protein 4)
MPIRPLLITLALLATLPLHAGDASLAGRIDAHIGQPRFAAAQWGIEVVSLDSGKVVYAHHADALLNPASAAKLITGAMALQNLGPATRVATTLSATGKRDGDRLLGSLRLQGGGDATFGTDPGSATWAQAMAAAVVAQGIRVVEGDIVAEDTRFESPPMGSGWEASDLQTYYGTAVSALTVDENIVQLNIQPAAREGNPVQLSFAPDDAALPVINRMTTTAAGMRADVNLWRGPGDNRLFVFGGLPQKAATEHFRLAIADSAVLAANRLRQALAQRQVRVAGSIRVVHWPELPAVDNGQVIASIASPPVAQIVHGGLKRSQNLYLQTLLLLCGVQLHDADRNGPAPAPGFLTTEAWGLRAMHAWLDRVGVSPSAALLEEGTGLSRRDLVTPGALVRVLTYMDKQPEAADYRDALPVAGVDGTLMYRMRNTAAEGKLQAKTGSMTFVHALAGYVTTAAGERLAFAIMLNNYDAPDHSATPVPSASSDVDTIATMLAAQATRF